MNWKWAMKRARQLAWIFGERYQVRGYSEEIGTIERPTKIWLYGVKRVEG